MKPNTFSIPEGGKRQFWRKSFGWLGAALPAALLAAVVLLPKASAQTNPCAQISLDGVSLNLCQSFMPAPFISTAAPTDAIQMATAVDRSAGYKEISISAIPFGLRSPAEDLPPAQAGGAAIYRKLLSDYRTQQGGQPQPGPSATFFGQVAPGIVSAASLPITRVTPEPVTITEWVVEAGGRLWIIRIIQAKPAGSQVQNALDISLSSPNVAQPSSSLAAQAVPQSQGLVKQGVAAAGDLPAPPWWNGEVCDYTHYTYPPLFYGTDQNPTHRTPYPLGASYRGVLACGPRPYYDSAPDVIVQFFTNAWGEYEWECVELSMRFMRLAYGIPPYSGNGKDVVWNYNGTELVKIVNGTPGEVPAPGDILSYCNGCVRVGHTAVVTAANVNAAGYGSLTVMEQNNSANGANTLQVSGWSVGAGVTGWLHFPGNGNVSGVVKDTGGQRRAGVQVRLQKWMVDLSTTTDANGAYTFYNIPAGSASVSASYSDGCGSVAGSVTASIVAYQTQSAPDIVMADLTGSLSGAVKNSGGQTVAGAQVTFTHCGVTRSTTTDSNGAYTFYDLPTGSASVTASYSDGCGSAAGSVTASVVAGQTQSAPDIVMADLTGSLSGAVKDSRGQLVSGAQMTFNHCGVTRSTTTDSNGAYGFANLPTGLGTVSALYTPGSCSVRGQADANISASQNLAMPNILLNVPPLYAAGFVADVTFPDQAVFAPGQPLVKTWRLENTGCLAWDSRFKLAFVHGDPMGGADVNVPNTAMGQTADFTVNLTAPLSGSRFGYWNLRNPQGEYFGPLIFPQVNVQAPSPFLTLQADPPSPANTSRVQIYARADGLPNFGAMRLLINGVEVVRSNLTELYYTWNTAGYSEIGHSFVVEAVTHSDPQWRYPQRLGIVYLLQGTTTNPNFAPDRPIPTSPPDWYSAIASTVPLCAQSADLNGDALQYQFEISSTAGISTSVWVTGCYTPASLNPGAYSWRAQAKDPSGAQSLWSAPQHFSLASGSAGITRFSALPVDADQVRLWPCTALTEPVTLSVRVNTAADGSGSWDVIGERAGACVTEATAPVWNTLPYADGTHLLQVVALSPAGAVMSDTVFYLSPRRPAPPVLLSPTAASGSPSDPAYLKSRSINFVWEAAARAQSYTLLVSTNPSPQDDPAPLARQTVDGNTLTYSLTLDSDYPELYWQVAAANASGSSASGVQRLIMDPAAPTCTLQSAPAGANTWQVMWAGLDNNGISGFNLHYSDPTIGQWLKWLINVPPAVTSALFTGLPGHNYGFWCQAVDLAGTDSDRRTYLSTMAR